MHLTWIRCHRKQRLNPEVLPLPCTIFYHIKENLDDVLGPPGPNYRETS